jgi:hypothetical protein
VSVCECVCVHVCMCVCDMCAPSRAPFMLAMIKGKSKKSPVRVRLGRHSACQTPEFARPQIVKAGAIVSILWGDVVHVVGGEGHFLGQYPRRGTDNIGVGPPAVAPITRPRLCDGVHALLRSHCPSGVLGAAVSGSMVGSRCAQGLLAYQPRLEGAVLAWTVCTES